MDFQNRGVAPDIVDNIIFHVQLKYLFCTNIDPHHLCMCKNDLEK